MKKIETAAVLGSGVMGSGIAALLAGAGVKTYLLDIVPKDAKPKDRSKIAKDNLKTALKAKPAAFYSKQDAELVTPGNFEDDLDKLAECDWVVEVIIENLEIKQKLMAQVAEKVGQDTIVSTNTSGIDIDAIAEGLPADFRKRWLGTHFFNPPRYMKLLEIIPGKDTDEAVVDRIATFGTNVLGKGIVYAKNTPSFVANRIGVYSMMLTMNQMLEDGLNIEQVDKVFGKALGRPKTAVYKTADLVGIDTMVHVAKHTREALADDPERDVMRVPEFVEKMVEAGRIGNKAKQGFYTKDKKTRERFVINPQTGEYEPLNKPKFDSIEKAKNIEDLAKRVRAVIMDGDDEGAQFAWKVTARSLAYTAARVPEIADRIVEIDRGMRWGYNWEMGPFELWDAIGVADSVKRMQADGIDVPKNVLAMLDDGADAFYERRDDGLYYYDLAGGQGYQKLEEDPRQILIPELKRQDKVVKYNNGAHLLDAGDGVLLLEFHTKMNAVDADIVNMINDAVDIAEQDGWKGIVIGNHADAFSAGANLMMVYMLAQQKEWGQVDQMAREFQDANMRMKYAEVPVVAAVGGMALGGGCEIAMHTDRVVFAGESYVGLVEVGVGLIPAGGGTKELLVKLQAGIPHGLKVLQLPYVQRAFENIGTAHIATSGKEAIEAGFVRPWQSRVVLNRDHIIHAAKQEVLGLHTAGYQPPRRDKITLAGGGVYGALLIAVDDMVKAGWASEYDRHIAKRLGKVLTGGDIHENTVVDEQFVLDLEREVFVSLCGEEKTQARIQHMLMNNRPLRN